MGSKGQKLSRLRRFNEWVGSNDAELREERDDLKVRELAGSPGVIDSAIEKESIALRRERPVLSIYKNKNQHDYREPADSVIWEQRLTKADGLLEIAAQAVGRIELQGGDLEWVGTGWLVKENIMVTNRHVANEFAVRKGQGFSFRMGSSGEMAASVDFLQEIKNPDTLVFSLGRVLHIEPAPGPDVAFFEVAVEGGDAKLAKHIDLAREPALTKSVATIGYPAYDSRIPEPDLMEHIFGSIYNKKRLAPGAVTQLDETRIWHNCTTLGGNSGSVVLDLESGQALGLHFSGSFLTTNYAVRSDVVKKILDDVRAGRRPAEAPSPRRPASGGPQVSIGGGPQSPGTASFTIPLTVTVTLGTAGGGVRPFSDAAARDDGTDLIDGDEAVVSDYRDRKGYVPEFLGTEVKLPTVKVGTGDVLPIESNPKSDPELKYQHFSVLMSRSRRMCFFSAVNINGKQSKKSKRVQWKWDPRLPRERQIMNECYGTPPKFSRGHMTRREDPGWGTTDKIAKLGNEDSMHVTNTTPQMQAFNAPIWLGLEDYALGHAREDEMKISVFTGPYFGKKDPERYGVRIPLAFWKIIAFIHDETGELCATGYEMNQKQSLQPDEEFVFGQFNSPQLGTATQVSIRSIERRSGIDFHGLAGVDPLAGDDEGFGDEGPRAPLASFEQIRFTR